MLLFSLKAAGKSKEEMKQRVPDLLEMVGLAVKQTIIHHNYLGAKNNVWVWLGH